MMREYARYVVPSMFAFLLTCIYSLVDGLFVGNFVGDAALAGVNVSFPLLDVVLALGTGIGLGGGVIASIERAQGHEEQFKRTIRATLTLSLIASIPVMIVLLVFTQPLCQLMGGRGETLTQATIYIFVLAWGLPFQTVMSSSIPLIRNMGHVRFAMTVSALSGVLNVILDALFIVVFGWGTAGASLATVISQIFCLVLVAFFFFKKENRVPRNYFRPTRGIVTHTLKLGLAPCGLILLPELMVVGINMSAAEYGGETALAAYAVIAYTVFVIQYLIQGVADGGQPLISRYYGEGDLQTAQRLRNTGYVLALGIALLGIAALWFGRFAIPELFGSSDEPAAMAAGMLPIFSLAYVFYAFTHTTTSFLYAMDNAKASTALVYVEALLVVVCVVSLGLLFGLSGVWWSMVCVQALLSVIALVVMRRALRSEPKRAAAIERDD